MPDKRADETQPTPVEAARADRAEVREVHQEARSGGADLYPSEDLVGGAGGFDSTPEEMTGALHRAGLLGKKTTRAAAEEALRLFRVAPVRD